MYLPTYLLYIIYGEQDYNKRLELELVERRRVGRMVASFLHSQKELMLQAEERLDTYRDRLEKVSRYGSVQYVGTYLRYHSMFPMFRICIQFIPIRTQHFFLGDVDPDPGRKIKAHLFRDHLYE